MQILIFHPQEQSDSEPEQIPSGLFAFPANQLLLKMVQTYTPFGSSSCRVFVPDRWRSPDLMNEGAFFYDPSGDWLSLVSGFSGFSNGGEWILSNASILTGLDQKWLRSVMSTFAWDLLAVRVDPQLADSREQVKRTSLDQIVGFRRQYQPSAEPDGPSEQWPDHLICRPGIGSRLSRIGADTRYPVFMDRCQKAGLVFRSIRVGGRRLDLFSPAGQKELLRFSQTCSQKGNSSFANPDSSVTIVGNVHFGRQVTCQPGAVVIAPAIVCDGAVIGARAVLREVLVGPSIQIPANSRIQSQTLLPACGQSKKMPLPVSGREWNAKNRDGSVFREWPLFSYPRFGKRLFDLMASICILAFFLPFFPIIALAVKLTSSGPVFYRARRQGLHGRNFNCLKFRTMLEKADSMQDLLRFASQVDGPQFKIEDDPRVSPIGKFLRDTCIDELPQFLNVLAGQMSMVGPRPSPENENEFCPAWRDARLSVRPGITGLWQVCRTRGASADFQEWIYYDTEYVRRISFRTDLWICFKTAGKLISLFLDQFG